MSGFSYPPPIFLSSTYNPAFYLSLDPSGLLSYAYAQTLYVSRNDYRLSYITGVTLGQGAAGLALTLDSGGNVSNINSLTAGSITASSLSGLTSLSVTGTLTAATVNATSNLQINGSNLDLSLVGRLNLTTLGTCEASKAIVLDSSRSCKNIHNLEIASTGTGIVCSTLKFWNDAGTATDTFNHRYLMGISEGGAAVSKALVLNSTGQITGIGSLSATTINATTLQIASTSITATAAQINKLATVTATAAELNKLAGCTATTADLNFLDLTTGEGTAENSKALVLNGSGAIDSINSLTATTLTSTTKNIAKTTAGAAMLSSSFASWYNLVLSNASNTAGATSGIAFINDSTTAGLSTLTPSAAIVTGRVGTGTFAPSYITFMTKSDATQGGTLTERLRINTDGWIGIGTSTPQCVLDTGSYVTDKKLSLFNPGTPTSTNVFYGFGANSNAVRYQTDVAHEFYVGSTLGGLGTREVRITSVGVVIGTSGEPTVPLDVIDFTSISMTGPQALGTSSSYSVNQSGTYIDNVSIYCRQALRVGVRGMYVGSDRRVKRNITTIPDADGSAFVREINPKVYNLRECDKRQIGYVSQDFIPKYSSLIQMMPDSTMHVESAGDVEGAYLSLDYNRVVPLLHAALRDVLERIEALEQALLKNA
jgi:hypothetical protein